MQNSCFGAFSKKETRLIAVILLCVFLLFLLFLLFGCTEMSRAQKNLCFSMTSQSYAYVPVCDTEKSCFEKVNAMFKTALSYQTESDLYELKNHAARSYYFYNLAVKEMAVLRNLCQSGNAQALGGEINQVKFYIDTAFLELDLAMKKSFDVVYGEEHYLSAEKVDLVKEESVYSSLVELRQIISELNGEATNSDTYVSYYQKKADEFSKSAYSKTSAVLVEKTPFWVNKTEYISGTILAQIGADDEGSFSFISTVADNVFSYFENIFYSRQNLVALQNFPASEFMKLYSDLGGNENSALKRFADLQNRTGAGLVEAKKNSENIYKLVIDKQGKCVLLASEAKTAPDFGAIAKELLSSEILAGDLNESADCFGSDVVSLREKISGAKLSLGEELSKLKSLNNSLDLLILRLNFKNTEYFGRLGEECDKKAAQVRAIKDSDTNPQVSGLLSDALFYASKTISSKDNEKLEYCGRLIEKSALYEQGKNNFALLDAKVKDSTKDCVTYLDAVLENAGLEELKLEFQTLKNTPVSEDNLAWFSNYCKSIKTQVDFELGSAKDLKKLQSDYEGLKAVVEKLGIAAAYFGDKEVDSRLLVARQKVSNYSKYFDNGSVLLDKVLPIEGFLAENILESKNDLEDFLKEKIIGYAKNKFEITRIDDSIASNDGDANFRAEIFIPNYISPVNDEFSIDTNVFILGFSEKDACIRGIAGENNSIILLSCLPQGGIFAEAVMKGKVETTQSDSFIFVSNGESLLKRNIRANNSFTTEKLRIGTTIPNNTGRFVVLVGKTGVGAVSEGGILSFVAENVNKETEINVFFYINGVIETSLVLKGSSNISGGEALSYDLVASNTSAEDVSAAISVLLPDIKNIQSISVTDSEFVSRQFERTDNSIILKNIGFLGKEVKTFKIQLTVNTAIDFYIGGLNKQLEYFESNGLTADADDVREYLLTAQTKTVFELSKMWEKNNQIMAQYESDRKAEINRALMLDQLKNKVADLRQILPELESAGLDSDAKTVSNLIDSISLADSMTESEISAALKKISALNFSVDQKLTDKAAELLADVQKIPGVYNDANISAEVTRFFENKKIFDSEAAFDPLKSGAAFIEMQKSYDGILTRKAIIDENIKIVQLEQAKKTAALIDDCSVMIDWLTGELTGKEAELIKEKFIPPITDSRLKKLGLVVSELKSSDANNAEKLAQLLEIKNELAIAVDSVKRQVVAKFNGGIDAGMSKDILSQSRSLIDSNRFVDAYFLLSGDSINSGAFPFPFEAFLPIIVIAVVAFVLKRSFGKKENAVDEKKKMILDEWERN